MKPEKPEDPKAKSINVRCPESLTRWYAEQQGSTLAGARLLLEAWPAVYGRELAHMRETLALSRAEANLILACNLYPFGGHLRIKIADAEQLNGIGAKWDVDVSAIQARLGALSPGQLAALEWWVASCWQVYSDDAEWEARVGELVGGE